MQKYICRTIQENVTDSNVGNWLNKRIHLYNVLFLYSHVAIQPFWKYSERLFSRVELTLQTFVLFSRVERSQTPWWYCLLFTKEQPCDLVKSAKEHPLGTEGGRYSGQSIRSLLFRPGVRMPPGPGYRGGMRGRIREMPPTTFLTPHPSNR